MQFNFKRKKLELRQAQYKNKRTALVAVDAESLERYGTLTVNAPEVELGDGEFVIKTWSENEDLAEVAFNSGFFEDTGKRAQFEHVTAEIWKISSKHSLSELMPL